MMCLEPNTHSNTMETSDVSMPGITLSTGQAASRVSLSSSFQSSRFSKGQLINICQVGTATVSNTSESRDSERQRLVTAVRVPMWSFLNT